MYTPLSRVLIRAPLLPVAALPRAARALSAHALGGDAIALASASLASARSGDERDRAVQRYARRAAFRATPSGLLAGVCVGALGPRGDVATGTPVGVLAPSWARLDALARALLDTPAVRGGVRLRTAPSLMRAPGTLIWIGPGDPVDETRRAELDDRLAAIVEAAAGWAGWSSVREAARGDGEDDADLDDLLLTLIDDGLLQTDLSPALVGGPPEAHVAARLRELRLDAEAAALDDASAALRAGDRARGTARLAELPGAGPRDVQAVLVHRPARRPRIARAAVERAAALVPLLLRLQEALAPPAMERLGSTALVDALDAATEIFGAGAFDLEGLATGAYGVDLGDDLDGDGSALPVAAAAPGPLGLLAGAFAAAARAGEREVALDAAALEAALPDVGTPDLPATAELFLSPARPRPGARPGAGWLLGLHGPAGASLGRFAHALGPALDDTLAEIAAAERRARPDQERLDVSFAPSAALADVCAHPAVRPRALAISRWTTADDGNSDLTLADLAVVADPGRPDALALRARQGSTGMVTPSPLWRVRSTTAPAGAARLAAGWTLQRQHAPWALALGPLAGLDDLPRVTLEGFVISPASWRVPATLRNARAVRSAIARWRREAGIPRHVQAGQSDELFPIDLDSPAAAQELAGAERVHEIWPPLGDTIDRDGRRLEVIVPVVRTGASQASSAELARVPPPAEAPPLPGWRTFKLFGPADRQDDLLLDTVLPAVDGARRAGEIDGWFFLRYEDGPGRRPHLRLRAHGRAGDEAFERRLRLALAPARASGALTLLETADYFPERGRFRADEMDGLHAMFQADSQAVATLLAEADEDPLVTGARLLDAIAAGCGMDARTREALAAERRAAAEGASDAGPELRAEADALFRAHGRALRAALAAPGDTLTALRSAVADAAAGLAPDRRRVLLPTLLHLSSVRWRGADPDGERLAYTLWQRALEGLRRAPPRAP